MIRVTQKAREESIIQYFKASAETYAENLLAKVKAEAEFFKELESESDSSENMNKMLDKALANKKSEQSSLNGTKVGFNLSPS